MCFILQKPIQECIKHYFLKYCTTVITDVLNGTVQQFKTLFKVTYFLLIDARINFGSLARLEHGSILRKRCYGHNDTDF